MNKDIVTDIVRKGYSHKEVIDKYVKRREIWPEEKLIFDRFFKNAGNILDVGCGTGRTSFYLASIGNKVTAIDISPDLIGAAKERLDKEPANIEFFVKDAHNLDYPEDYFDGIVFSFNGIDCLVRKEGKIRFLKEAKRILKSEKPLFFTARNLLCINSYFPRNMIRVFKIFFSKIFHFNIQEKEYGERYDNRPGVEVSYIDIKPKRTWDKIIKESGLSIILFNSKYGIRDKREFSLRDYFGLSNYLFFVFKK